MLFRANTFFRLISSRREFSIQIGYTQDHDGGYLNQGIDFQGIEGIFHIFPSFFLHFLELKATTEHTVDQIENISDLYIIFIQK